VHGGEKPRAKRAALGVEGRRSAPYVHERLLDCVLGATGVAQDPDREAVRERAIPVEKTGERILTACGELRGKLAVARLSYDVPASTGSASSM